MDIQIICAAILSFCMFLAVIAVLFRMTEPEAAILWMIRAFTGIGIIMGIVLSGYWGASETLFWVSLYSLLTMVFVFGVFSIMEASLTIRIFTEIARSGGGVTSADLMKNYNKSRIIRRRITRLIYSGELKRVRDTYIRGRISYFSVREVLFELLLALFPVNPP